jgi:hypothetical protein
MKDSISDQVDPLVPFWGIRIVLHFVVDKLNGYTTNNVISLKI